MKHEVSKLPQGHLFLPRPRGERQSKTDIEKRHLGKTVVVHSQLCSSLLE